MEDFLEYIQFTRRARQPGPRRYFRDYDDPFTKYSEQGFFNRYRFLPGIVKNVLVPHIAAALGRETRRGLPFPPEIQILVALRYYATGSFQIVQGDLLGICQQSISRIIKNVSLEFALKSRNVIKFPSAGQGLTNNRQKFFDIAGFPGVLGCLDCTHVCIKSPGGSTSEVYRNRKGKFSINVQAVVGPDLQFFDIVVRWPGSAHDSFIYNSSSLKQRMLSGELTGYLLGDSGDAVSPVLMTPYLNPTTPAQFRYNSCQIRTRNVIERAFGVWKRRFPCLRSEMAMNKQTIITVICACATLFNLAIQHNDLYEPLLEDEENENDEVIPENSASDVFALRNALAERVFAN